MDDVDGQWQPIETAPKNGEFLVWRGRVGGTQRLPSVRIAYYSGIAKAIIYASTSWQIVSDDYTHWQPLPKPPGTQEQSDGGRNV